MPQKRTHTYRKQTVRNTHEYDVTRMKRTSMRCVWPSVIGSGAWGTVSHHQSFWATCRAKAGRKSRPKTVRAS